MFSDERYLRSFNQLRDLSVTAKQPPISSSFNNRQLTATEAMTSSVTAEHRRMYSTDKERMLGNNRIRTVTDRQSEHQTFPG